MQTFLLLSCVILGLIGGGRLAKTIQTQNGEVVDICSGEFKDTPMNFGSIFKNVDEELKNKPVNVSRRNGKTEIYIDASEILSQTHSVDMTIDKSLIWATKHNLTFTAKHELIIKYIPKEELEICYFILEYPYNKCERLTIFDFDTFTQRESVIHVTRRKDESGDKPSDQIMDNNWFLSFKGYKILAGSKYGFVINYNCALIGGAIEAKTIQTQNGEVVDICSGEFKDTPMNFGSIFKNVDEELKNKPVGVSRRNGTTQLYIDASEILREPYSIDATTVRLLRWAIQNHNLTFTKKYKLIIESIPNQELNICVLGRKRSSCTNLRRSDSYTFEQRESSIRETIKYHSNNVTNHIILNNFWISSFKGFKISRDRRGIYGFLLNYNCEKSS